MLTTLKFTTQCKGDKSDMQKQQKSLLCGHNKMHWLTWQI